MSERRARVPAPRPPALPRPRCRRRLARRPWVAPSWRRPCSTRPPRPSRPRWSWRRPATGSTVPTTDTTWTPSDGPCCPPSRHGSPGSTRTTRPSATGDFSSDGWVYATFCFLIISFSVWDEYIFHALRNCEKYSRDVRFRKALDIAEVNDVESFDNTRRDSKTACTRLESEESLPTDYVYEFTQPY